MKMRRLYILLLAAAALCACSTEQVQESHERTGSLRLRISGTGEFVSRGGGETAVNPDEFEVTISRKDDEWTRTWDRFADIEGEIKLAPGSYTVSAGTANALPAAFDQPVYQGTADFSIRNGETSTVNIACSLANMKVTLRPSDRLDSELTDYRVIITNAASWTAPDIAQRQLSWSKADIAAGKTGYFSVAPLLGKIYGYRATDAHEAEVPFTINDVAACDFHLLKIDAVVTGQGVFTITIDDTVNEKVDDILIPGFSEAPVEGHHEGEGEGQGEEPTNTAPKMSWDVNPGFAPTPIEDQMDINIRIEAPEKIASFVVGVDSYILSDVIAAMAGDSSYSYASDGPYDMDLIGNATLVAALASIVPTGDALLGQTSVQFTLSDLVPLILGFSPQSGSEHTFTLKVSDQKGQSLQKALTFYVL